MPFDGPITFLYKGAGAGGADGRGNVSTITYNSGSGTVAWPSGSYKALVKIWGGGGGGGGSASITQNAAGGGGGGYSEKLYTNPSGNYT